MGIFILGSVAIGAFASSELNTEQLDYEFKVSRSILDNAATNYCLDVADISDQKWKAYQKSEYEPRRGENPDEWKEKRAWDCRNVKVELDFH